MPEDDPFLIDSHKLAYHPDRVNQYLQADTYEKKLAVFPLYIEISPVGHCNHRCTFCAVDYIGYKTRSLSLLDLTVTLRSMGETGVKSVMFAGEGEPLLHPEIAEIAVEADRAGLDIAFTTNGTAITKKFIDLALPVTKWIKVSMNGGEKTYAKIHQTTQEHYSKVWKNIENCIRSRRDGHYQTTIGLQCVVLPDNMGEILALCSRAKETGLDYIVLKPYSQHLSSPAITYKEVKYHDKRDLLLRAAQLSNNSFHVVVRTNAMADWDIGHPTYTTCYATPFLWAYIMANGDVYSCSAYLLDERFKLGNITENSFTQIWLGSKRRAHIEFIEKELDISKCRLNCRMNQVNKYLKDVTEPGIHKNFI